MNRGEVLALGVIFRDAKRGLSSLWLTVNYVRLSSFSRKRCLCSILRVLKVYSCVRGEGCPNLFRIHEIMLGRLIESGDWKINEKTTWSRFTCTPKWVSVFRKYGLFP